MPATTKRFTIRHEDLPKNRVPAGTGSVCSVMATIPRLFHLVRIHQSKPHYHKRATEFYYVLEGKGTMTVDGETFPIAPGTMIKPDPGAVHTSEGDFLVMVVGVPDIQEDDIFFPEES